MKNKSAILFSAKAGHGLGTARAYVLGMILHHFTTGISLRAIAEHGLTVGDVPTGSDLVSGTVGVWLTSSDQSQGHGLGADFPEHLNKTRFRLTVDAPSDKLVRWVDWSAKHVTPEGRASLHAANGASYESWYIYFGWIQPDLILGVTDMLTGEAVPDWRTLWPKEMSLPGVRYRDRHAWHKRLLRDVRRGSMPEQAKRILYLNEAMANY